MNGDATNLKTRTRRVGAALVLLALLLTPLAAAPGQVDAQGGSISGMVTGPSGALPPAGAVVRLLKPDHSTFGQAAVDPLDGSFSLSGIPNGNYALRAAPPMGSDLTHSLPVPVSVLGAPVDVGEIALTHPQVVGTVYAPGGATPASALVHIDSAGRATQTTPAPGGEIQIGGLPSGTYVFRAWPVGDDLAWASRPMTLTLSAGVSHTIDLALTPADVVGRAVDAVGNPVQDAVARVVDAGGNVLRRDLTSANGVFALGGLNPGRYGLTLEAPWWLRGLIAPDPVVFTAPPAQDLGAIAFMASNKLVSGQVETHTGQGVLGALVHAQRVDQAGQVRTTSGANGRYGLALSEGLWALTVRPISGTAPAAWVYPHGPQWVHFAHDKQPESKTVDFRVLTADSRVTGAVEMPAGGAPPFTVTVRIHTTEGIGRSVAADPASGAFSVDLPHGAYKVSVLPEDEGTMGPAVEDIRLPPNTTLDLGTLTLLERNAAIGGQVTARAVVAQNGLAVHDALANPVADVPVLAWRPDAPGSAATRTGPDGVYALPVVSGTWWVQPAPLPTQPWLYASSPVEIEIEANQVLTGVDMALVPADAAIEGVLVDEEGLPVTGVEGWTQAVQAADPAMQKGTPVEDGAFRVLVPAGTYDLSLKLPEGARWIAVPLHDVSAASGETTAITLTLRVKDAAIGGALWDRRQEEVVTGVQAQVMAYSAGAWVRTEVSPGNGAYLMGVSSGLWTLGYRVDPNSTYVALRQRRSYPVASGQTVPAPLPVAEKDGLLSGLVLDPAGAPLAGAEVIAESVSAELDDLSLRTLSGADGRFGLAVPHGHYRVRAAAGGGWISPVSARVSVPAQGSAGGLILQFLEPNAEISGTVTISGTQHPGPTAVKVWGYSAGDGAAHSEAELGGPYALEVLSGTQWHVGAAVQSGSQYWLARESVRVSQPQVPLDLSLEGPYPLPAPVTVQFDAGEAQYVELADGTSIYIPAGALPVTGRVTLQVAPIATYPHQRHANVYRYGYALTAHDAYGQPIEAQFNLDVLITFGYHDAELRRQGLSEQWIKPAYWSTTTDNWTFPVSYVVDTVNNVVAMEVDHFTDFALTGPTRFEVYLPVVGQ